MLLDFKSSLPDTFLDLRSTLVPILTLWTTANEVLSLKRQVFDS